MSADRQPQGSEGRQERGAEACHEPTPGGRLFVVATPIGNLEDLTLRAQRVLGSVQWVACEDTRRTGRLLQGLGLRKRLISLWQGNEDRSTGRVLERLLHGEQGALVSDGGTPLVSDPGYDLVRQARAAGIPVVPVPGPSAVMAALSCSGLPCVPFVFLGFLPRSAGARRRKLETVRDLKATLVLFESPERVVGTLKLAEDVLGPRPAAVARELTKLHEEVLGGTLAELRAELSERPRVRGEITVVVGGAPQVEAAAGDGERARAAQAPAARGAAVARGASAPHAPPAVAAELGLRRRRVYSLALSLRDRDAQAGPKGGGEPGPP